MFRFYLSLFSFDLLEFEETNLQRSRNSNTSYITGKYQLNIMTDHKPLLKLNGTSSNNMEGWLPRWSSALEVFDFMLIYNSGK